MRIGIDSRLIELKVVTHSQGQRLIGQVPGKRTTMQECSHHAGNELVDLLLAVAPNTTLLEGVALLLEALQRGAELERPEEVVSLLEGSTNGPDLVDQVLDGGNTLLAKSLLNDGVVVESNARLVDLAIAALVDKLAHGIAGRVAVGDVRLNHADHVDGGAVKSHEDTVVELAQTEELHDLLLLGWQLVNTIK